MVNIFNNQTTFNEHLKSKVRNSINNNFKVQPLSFIILATLLIVPNMYNLNMGNAGSIALLGKHFSLKLLSVPSRPSLLFNLKLRQTQLPAYAARSNESEDYFANFRAIDFHIAPAITRDCIGEYRKWNRVN